MPTVHVQHQGHANSRLRLLFLNSLHFNRENNSTRTNKCFFGLVTNKKEWINDYRGSVVQANAKLSKVDDMTLQQVKSQRSLVVHWHRTVTARAPLKFKEVWFQLSVQSQRSVEDNAVSAR